MRLIPSPREISTFNDHFQELYELGEAWRQWEVYSCTERGGHWFWLEVDTEACIELSCRACRWTLDDLYPDGIELLYAELRPGLVIENGSVSLKSDPAYGWKGPVRLALDEVHYRGWDMPDEWDVSLTAEPL